MIPTTREMADSRSARPVTWLGSVLCAVALSLLMAAPASTAPSAAQAARPAAAVALRPAAPSPGHESQFVSRINGLRASKGLGQLQISGDLVGVARRWTERMLEAGQISHNPNLANEVPGAWTKLGENVGVGYDVDGLMEAFINSPAHYRNLVDPEWTHVGVGVTVSGDGRMWTTHNFMTLGSSPPPPPPPPPPPSPGTTAPRPGGSGPGTTVAPPATTTTTAPPQPEPTADRVSAVLDPLRSLEG